MKYWKRYLLGLAVSLGSAWYAHGQQVTVAAPGAAAAAPTKNLWSFFMKTPEQATRCRDKWCNSAVGQMMASSMKPMAAMTGGMVKGKCALPSATDLAKPAESSEGAAARIKADEAAAAARREAVRFLGTVDCNYWPEAEEALINALRGDRNECVRLEAAISLGRGCCCTAKIIEALTITVMGTDKDGFPPEKSDRVKAAAAEAISACSLDVTSPTQPEMLPTPKDKEKAMVDPNDYYHQVAKQSPQEAVKRSRQQLAQAGPVQKRPQGLLGIVTYAMAAPKKAGPATSAPALDITQVQPSAPAAAPVQVPPLPKVQPVSTSTSVLPPRAEFMPHPAPPSSQTGPASAPRQHPQGLLQLLGQSRAQPMPHQVAPPESQTGAAPAPRQQSHGLLQVLGQSLSNRRPRPQASQGQEQEQEQTPTLLPPATTLDSLPQ